MSNKRVLIGMSGGVDSTASAIILKEQGYEVIGATMKLWGNTDTDVKEICDKIGIQHHTIDCTKQFKEKVVDNFIQCYQCCKTPNPCVECNKYLKFGEFYKKAQELECQYISTGHYAKVEYSEKYKQYVMKKSKAEKKDQTYFLYGINKNILPKMIFPLENIKEKEEVREIAKKYNLPVAEKKDSEEICFIPENDYVKFIHNNTGITEEKQGNIILQDGTILGKHKGLINYTIGQRKGLGIAYTEPLYVLKLDKENNLLIVGEENKLYSKNLIAENLNFLINIDFTKEIEVKAKIRYRAKEAQAILKILEDGKAFVEFKEPQRAITPGQSAVFYIDDNILLGGGIIVKKNANKLS